MKSYTQIWKTRNLTVKRKTYLFPKWGRKLKWAVPDRCKIKINVIIWKCIWDDKINQIDRNVVLLGQERGWNGNDKY